MSYSLAKPPVIGTTQLVIRTFPSIDGGGDDVGPCTSSQTACIDIKCCLLDFELLDVDCVVDYWLMNSENLAGARCLISNISLLSVSSFSHHTTGRGG